MVPADRSREADLTITGTPLQLLHLLIDRADRSIPAASGVVLQGDVLLAKQLLDLFESHDIDWEDQLSRYIGDIPAYHATHFIKRVRDYANRTCANLSDNIKDYLHEEAMWLPGRERLDDFFEDVDRLREASDRLEARIARLKMA